MTEVPDLQVARGRLFGTVTEVAAVLEVDPRTVRHGITAGTIPSVKVAGNTIRVPWVPFLRDVCGLTDEVLETLGLPGYATDPGNSEAAPDQEAATATVHTLPGERETQTQHDAPKTA